MQKIIFKNKFLILLFLAIVAIACILRLYNLQAVPPGVNRDEASIGWTAYSLLHTGRDEYGRLFPLSFQSFGDWKLPLYVYSVMASVAIFGLGEFAVRLPAALAGIGVVILAYFLVDELTHNRKLAFLAMFLTAIAPWDILLSRASVEANLAVLLVAIATLCFLKSLRKRNWLLILSAIFFALTYFTYAGDYVFTTLLVPGLVFLYRKSILKTKTTFLALVVFLLLSGFIGTITLSANRTKISGISIFGDPAVVHAQIEMPRNQHANPNSFEVRLFYNKVVFAGETFLKNYFNSFSPQFLFENGGTNHDHNILNFGNGYLVETPFFLLGLVYLIALMKGKEKKLILWWVLISPVAAAITKDAPHTTRQLAIFPMFTLVTALGIWYLISAVNNQLFKKAAVLIIVAAFVFNFGIFLDRYFLLFPRSEAANWGFIYRDLSIKLQKPEFKNKQIIISQPEHSPYIFLLFYQKYDPETYQKQAVRYPLTSDGFLNVKQFGRFTFRDINWGEDLHLRNTVLVDNYDNIPFGIRNKQAGAVYLPSGQEIFGIIETK